MVPTYRMRMLASVVSSGSLWLILVLESLGAAAADSVTVVQGKRLAERTFATADKANKGYLDEKSLRDARHILRGVLKSDARRNFPGGEASADGVISLTLQGNPDEDEDGKTTRDEFIAFVVELMKNRDTALADARKQVEEDRKAMLKAQQAYLKWLTQLLQRTNRKRR